MTDLVLKVNGKAYAGWKSIRVTRGIEAVSGGFDLSVSERWANQGTPWPIGEEDECSVSVGNETLITGYVDRRSLSYGPEEHTLSVSGRDRTGLLVDCSAYLAKWEFLSVPVLTLAQRIAAPFDIRVSLQAGVSLPAPPAKLSIDPGDSAFEAIERACRMAGLLPVSDGQGGLVLTRAGTARAAGELIEGQNILAARAEYDATGRYRTYYVLGQHRGSDDNSGVTAAGVKGTAGDENVRRSSRVLVVRPEGNATAEHARKRAEWEAKIRAARGDAVSVTVQGWTQVDGTLWPVNRLVHVHSPMIGVSGDLLITQAVYSLDEGGTVTELTLKRPDAFLPEPTVTKANTARWKEIAGGV